MLIRDFRKKEFVDREEEINFIKEWINKTPDEILWLYGPKSTGKTTLIEYIIENDLTRGLKIFNKHWIKYINFRGKLIGSYDSFLKSFIKPKTSILDSLGVNINLGIISINYKLYNEVKKGDIDLFDAVIEELKQIDKIKLIVIDEIQTLEDIYYNGEKELLKEFLNFCVRLTKELHLSHIIILSSNTIFIERIYNDAKLKVTSRFKKIDHLDKSTIFEYLEYKGIKKDNEKELIYDYLGGCIPLIQRLFRERKYYNSIEEYLENEVSLAESEIIDLMRRYLDDKKRKAFKEIIKEIVDNKYYIVKEDEELLNTELIDSFAEKEIFFYDPLTRKVTGNNRLYEKAFELLLN